LRIFFRVRSKHQACGDRAESARMPDALSFEFAPKNRFRWSPARVRRYFLRPFRKASWQ
jgi:hypothetical protein